MHGNILTKLLINSSLPWNLKTLQTLYISLRTNITTILVLNLILQPHYKLWTHLVYFKETRQSESWSFFNLLCSKVFSLMTIIVLNREKTSLFKYHPLILKVVDSSTWSKMWTYVSVIIDSIKFKTDSSINP